MNARACLPSASHVCWLLAATMAPAQQPGGAQPPEAQSQPSSRLPAGRQDLAKVLVGTWKWAWPDEGSQTRIELQANRSYEWWAPYLQSDLAARTMIQTGKWSVQKSTLSLRIEEPFLSHLSPGTTFTYEIVSVSSREVLLSSPLERRQFRWTRVSPQDEPFWAGALSYGPPFKMRSYLYATNAGPSAGDWELNSVDQAGTNGTAQVVFHLGTVAEFIGADRPAKPLETVADLKAFVDTELKNNPRGGSPLTSIVNIGGREALMTIAPTNQVPGEPIKWHGSVCLFWEVKPVWQNTTICSIMMTAETRGTFNLLTNSLKTIKLLGGKQKN